MFPYQSTGLLSLQDRPDILTMREYFSRFKSAYFCLRRANPHPDQARNLDAKSKFEAEEFRRSVQLNGDLARQERDEFRDAPICAHCG